MDRRWDEAGGSDDASRTDSHETSSILKTMTTFFEAQNELAESGAPFATVTVVDTMGSTPQDRGAKMLADETEPNTRFFQWSLEKDIGMTCGGIVRVYFEVFNVTRWNIVVFGAGHVAHAVVELLSKLDCRITCIDPREEWLARVPSSPKVTKVHTADMPSQVAGIPEGAYVLLMTMGHTTDKPILLEILRTRTFPYLGVIGSHAKAKRLRQDVLDAGLAEESTKAFLCPVGLEIGSNHPHEIAVSVAAQMLQIRG